MWDIIKTDFQEHFLISEGMIPVKIVYLEDVNNFLVLTKRSKVNNLKDCVEQLEDYLEKEH